MTNHLNYTLHFPKANFIDNEWISNGSGKTLTVSDKYSQEIIAVLPLASEEQVMQAIRAAEKGFQIYSRWSVGKRAEKLELLKEGLIHERDNFVHLIVAEAGKPLDFAEIEVDRGIATLEATIRALYQFSGEVIPIDYGPGEGKTAFTKRFPIGIVACITPFNFPLNLALHKIAPALAVGCSFILKTPPQTPLTALLLAKLCQEVGFPSGVVNVLVADIPEAEILVKSEQIKMLSFTGSAKVGWHLKNIAGKKKVALELGGNAAVIIDETANLPQIAPTIAKAAQLYAGQICISTQRIILLESIYEQFLPLLIKETQKLLVGNPAERGCVVGPVIDRLNLLRIASWVEEALNKGANILLGGQILDESHNLYAPTLLSNVSNQMKVVSEEVFAPVAVVELVKDFAEAIQKVNDSPFGLQAGVFTQQIERMRLAHNELEVGGVIINQVPGFRIDNMPYGGVKESGLGREGVRYTMEEMTEPRLLVY